VLLGGVPGPDTIESRLIGAGSEHVRIRGERAGDDMTNVEEVDIDVVDGLSAAKSEVEPARVV
jgi:hypothetical protein